MSLALPSSAVRVGLRSRLPGLSVAAMLALAAAWIAGGLGEPLSRNPVLVAMLFGLLVGNCFGCPEGLRAGLDFTKRYLLRLAVVLVGFRITGRLLVDLGPGPLLVAAVELTLVVTVLYFLASRLLDRTLALLVAIGSAVCGAAAILSAAAVVRARDQDAGIAIALITLSGTAALLVYPVAFIDGWLPNLDDRLYGVFVGASIYELAQVYGASFAISDGALNTATLVKLSKVLMLIPLLIVLTLIHNRRGAASHSFRIPVPWFIAGFVAVVAINSQVTLDPRLRQLVLGFDQFLFLMVMVALGLTTRIARLAEGGAAWRLCATGLLGLALSTSVTYGLVASLAGAHTALPMQAESRMLNDPGGRLFSQVGCAKCHVPGLMGNHGEVTLYSDLLLHDMGPALDDKIVQGSALGSEWRTMPLVGLGLRERYLHDGRATKLRDAILAHGGEAEIVRNRFFRLDEDERREILQFLREL